MAQTANYVRALYQARKALGRCPVCGAKKAKDGYVLCERCRRVARERERANLAAETPSERFKRNELNRITQNARRERLRAEGKCPYCGEPALPGHLLCQRHNEENNRRSRERATRKEADRA